MPVVRKSFTRAPFRKKTSAERCHRAYLFFLRTTPRRVPDNLGHRKVPCGMMPGSLQECGRAGRCHSCRNTPQTYRESRRATTRAGQYTQLPPSCGFSFISICLSVRLSVYLSHLHIICKYRYTACCLSSGISGDLVHHMASFKLTAHELKSFGPNFPRSCLYLEICHPLRRISRLDKTS